MPESVDRPAPVRATSGRSARTSRAASIASTPGRTGESTTLPAYGRPGDAAPGRTAFALLRSRPEHRLRHGVVGDVGGPRRVPSRLGGTGGLYRERMRCRGVAPRSFPRSGTDEG